MSEMKPTRKLNADAQFFFDHAGWSYAIAKESPEEGRTRCAENLAASEALGRAADLSFHWTIDPYADSSDHSDEIPVYALWQCVCYDHCGVAVESVGGVDFGRDGSPWSDPYRRVCEAELVDGYIASELETVASAGVKG